MTERFVAREDRPLVTYGPAAAAQDGGFVLLVSTDEGQVEIAFGEQAMYDLWTEVKGVPWPARAAENAEKDRLVREVVHYANGADEEMLRDALEALGGRR